MNCFAACVGCTKGLGCGSNGSCCRGVRPLTPLLSYQRPGLPLLNYRMGSHGDFLASMKARLAARPELTKLTVRAANDPSIALLDCWAVIADIVTLYGERALNEGFLGTAADPESVSRLGRLVGYRPRPALGASGHLAFSMDPGAIGTIPAGTSAKSVPGPGELPQTFETSETVEARADWNELAVRRTRPFAISTSTLADFAELTFEGSSLNLKPGDLLVFDLGGATKPHVREVAAVTPDYQANRTLVGLVPEPNHPVGVELAIKRVAGAVRQAAKGATTAFEKSVSTSLAVAARGLGRAETRVHALATLHRQVTEAQAFAEAGRLKHQETAWVAGPLGAVADTVRQAGPLAAANTRSRSAEVAYLEQLATALTCPAVGEETGGRVDRVTCARAVPLLATAAALRALRRPPSQPPKHASALPQNLTSAFDPGSRSLVELLASTDPRLAGTLDDVIGQQVITAPVPTSRVVALRTKATPIGDEVSSGDHQVSVDGAPDNLVPGGWMVSRRLGDKVANQLITRIESVEHYVRSLKIDGKPTPVRMPTTHVLTTGPILPSTEDVDLNTMTLWFGDQPLNLAEEPLNDSVGGTEIALAKTYPGLKPGHRLIVTGERCDIPGVPGVVASELSMVGAIEQRIDLNLPGDVTRPVLILAAPLAYEYVRESVTIHANVVAATQGETRSEVLGSGMAGAAGQSFTLKQPTADYPLTVTSSVPTADVTTTLTVRVDKVRWHPTDVLADAGPRDQIYAEEHAAGSAVTVRFGDGIHGSRLPNGIENVTATYRVGAGSGGNIAPDQVRQLTSRPLGVGAVTNPLPMTGGTRGDAPEDAREVVPLATLALDRLVSVADYADFAAAHAGIAKAAAVQLYDGHREVVHLTVAAVDDVPADGLVTTLEGTLAARGDPHLPVRIDLREELWLVLSAGIKVLPDYLFDDVATRVRAHLLDQVGFHRARLGEPVYLSKLITVMHQTTGVDYVDVDAFGALPGLADPVKLLSSVLVLSGIADPVQASGARQVHEEYIVGHDPTGSPDVLSTIALRHGLTVGELVQLNPLLRSSAISEGQRLTVAHGLRPAQLAYFNPAVPQTLILRSIT